MSITDNYSSDSILVAANNNNASGMANSSYSKGAAPNKNVLWVESHDTYMNESSRYGSDMSILRTWAIVANKDNAAKLFFVRPYYSDDTLIDGKDGAFRGDLKTSLTPAIMGECPTYTWASNEAAAINHFNNRFVNCKDNIGCDGSVMYCQRGQGIVLVNLNGSGNVRMSSHGLADGVYTDEITGNTFTVSNGQISGQIGSTGIAVVYNAEPIVKTPTPTISKEGGEFSTDTLTLTIGLANATSGTYKIGNGSATTYTGSKSITIGSDMSIGDSVTITLTATDGKETKTK
jgi:alpha-amylase